MKKTLVWFVISAAFIGPGTVTTATSAGANFGAQLLWTVVFAVFACIVLQEGAARINIASGLSLGQAIASVYKSKARNSFVAMAIVFTIVLGCAAYEAGNILGAVSGITLTSGIDRTWLTLGIILLAAILLFTNSFKVLTNFLAAIIGVMGLGLIVLLCNIDINVAEAVRGLTLPKIPTGAELLTIGLIGTTVVPYNLFLGSRIGQSQEIQTMRRGLTISVLVGGVISIALILIGSKIEGEFSFANIATTLSALVGGWSHYVFAFGLFAAGLTSAITAPWAASITVTSTLNLKNKVKAFRFTWIIILLSGLIFGVSNVKPVPIIILAQALNGIILPFLSIMVFIILNDEKLMKDHSNKLVANLALLAVVWITLILGLLNLLKAFYASFQVEQTINNPILIILSLVSLLVVVLMGLKRIKT
jgi:manganese transport protein